MISIFLIPHVTYHDIIILNIYIIMMITYARYFLIRFIASCLENKSLLHCRAIVYLYSVFLNYMLVSTQIMLLTKQHLY